MKTIRYSLINYIPFQDHAFGDAPVEVPIGIALWNSQLVARRPGASDRVPRPFVLFDFAEDFLFADAADRKLIVEGHLDEWVEKGLPYADPDARLLPNTDAWWNHARGLLVHGIRLSAPQDFPPVDDAVAFFTALSSMDDYVERHVLRMAVRWDGRRAVRALLAFEADDAWQANAAANLPAARVSDMIERFVHALLMHRESMFTHDRDPVRLVFEEVFMDGVRCVDDCKSALERGAPRLAEALKTPEPEWQDTVAALLNRLETWRDYGPGADPGDEDHDMVLDTKETLYRLLAKQRYGDLLTGKPPKIHEEA